MRKSTSGVALLEMILALTIFSLVMVALAQSLQSAVEAATIQQQEQVIHQQMESLMAWVKLDPKDPERFKVLEKPDGTHLKPSAEPLEFKNKDGEDVKNLFTLKIQSIPPDHATNRARSIEMIIYAP